MTSKHRDPAYLANARIVRARVRRDWRHGVAVHCWRCGCEIEPGRPFDVGHLDPDGGNEISNLAPECRRCNRSDGGRRGAAITNARRRATTRAQPSRVVAASRAGFAPW